MALSKMRYVAAGLSFLRSPSAARSLRMLRVCWPATLQLEEVQSLRMELAKLRAQIGGMWADSCKLQACAVSTRQARHACFALQRWRRSSMTMG